MAWNEPGGNGQDPQDPWGSGNRGKKGGDQGPPDLDEVLRKVQDQLNSIFGGKSSGGGDGENRSGGGFSSGSLIFGLIIAIVVWAGMGFYTVDQQERGVVLRFGEYHDIVAPGLRWNPPLIDQVIRVNVTKVRSLDHRAPMLTEDENIVEVGMSVQYVVADPKAFVLNVREPEASLAQATESALRHVVGGSEMHSVLTEGREILAAAVQERLQAYIDSYGTGVQVSRVNIENATAPKQVQSAFDDVIKAREDEQRVKNEAEAYANGIVPEARGRAQRILEEANAYREEVVAKAEGEAERFLKLLAEYRKAPGVTRERLYIDTLQEVYANSSKVLVDVKGGNNMMYLPLDKLTEASQNARSNRSLPSTLQQARLSNADIERIADDVLNELRKRQPTIQREGR